MKISQSGDEYAEHFSNRSFWQKVRRFALTAGKEVIEKVLALYHAALDRDTPTWAKTVIVSALGYFILPLDAIPDMVPGAGYADDLGAVSVAIATVAAHIKPEHWKKARSQVRQWFGSRST